MRFILVDNQVEFPPIGDPKYVVAYNITLGRDAALKYANMTKKHCERQRYQDGTSVYPAGLTVYYSDGHGLRKA